MAFEVGPPPGTNSVADALEYVFEELQKVRDEFESARDILYLVERHTEPEKPREGMIALADGSDWDPGSGRGVYVYLSGAWDPLKLDDRTTYDDFP